MSEINRRELMGAAALAFTAAGGATVARAAWHAAGTEEVAPSLQSEPGPMDRILLKDYQPRSSVVVPATSILKARYPAIDVHSHGYGSNPENLAERVKIMDQAGLETVVVLTGATGEALDRQVALYGEAYPGRFQVYAGFDRTGIDRPDYPKRIVEELERSYEKGARGLGELSDKGRGYARGNGSDRLHMDDPRLDLFWDKCAELKIPVNVHQADHPSCWTPADVHQERTPNFQRYIQYGGDGRTYDELLAIRDRTLAKHPKTTFIFCHLSNQGNDLGALGSALDKYPNLYLDMSARHYEMNRTPRAAAKFLAKYPDRVLFGTDLPGVRTTAMFENYWRLLETADEYLPGPSWWRLYGLELPASLLEPLYRGNAKRLMNWEPV